MNVGAAPPVVSNSVTTDAPAAESDSAAAPDAGDPASEGDVLAAKFAEVLNNATEAQEPEAPPRSTPPVLPLDLPAMAAPAPPDMQAGGPMGFFEPGPANSGYATFPPPERGPFDDPAILILFASAALAALLAYAVRRPVVRVRLASITRRQLAAGLLSAGMAIVAVSFFLGSELRDEWEPVGQWLYDGTIAAAASVAAAFGLYLLLVPPRRI